MGDVTYTHAHTASYLPHEVMTILSIYIIYIYFFPTVCQPYLATVHASKEVARRNWDTVRRKTSLLYSGDALAGSFCLTYASTSTESENQHSNHIRIK